MTGAISVAGIKQSAPEQGSGLARNVIWLGVLWLVHRHLIPFSIAAPLTMAGVQAWSSIEKAAIRGVLSRHMSETPLVLTRKVTSVSSSLHFDSLGQKLRDFVSGLDASAQAALPSDFGQNLDNLANDFATEGKALVADEVSVAQKEVPPDWQGVLPALAEFADQKVDEANAKFQSEVAKWNAVKAAATPSVG